MPGSSKWPENLRSMLLIYLALRFQGRGRPIFHRSFPLQIPIVLMPIYSGLPYQCWRSHFAGISRWGIPTKDNRLSSSLKSLDNGWYHWSIRSAGLWLSEPSLDNNVVSWNQIWSWQGCIRHGSRFCNQVKLTNFEWSWCPWGDTWTWSNVSFRAWARFLGKRFWKCWAVVPPHSYWC